MASPAAAAAAPLPAVEFGAIVPQRPESWQDRDPLVCAGVDEVGRGCLFGPVFASAVILPAQAFQTLVSAGLTDSKKLTARRRAALVPLIEAEAFAWALGQASAAEIDRYGIRPATERAMHRALQRLPRRPQLVLVDGNLPLRGWSGEQRALVGGDASCPAISAASVLAKQCRDALLERLALQFPGYGLERHRGYGTAQHRAALQRLGPTALHRRSFLKPACTSRGSPPAAAAPPGF
ncbi:ribonuclease HII [Synechococcus sp. CBW1006]|uniref:ribonuclease HII n=1 Tax=Synechococcus sp. CBW1006 TaxID=1353138 RepID=UPI0018CE820F|nr:ribonuclease HII [Synechococcus sp. CBW1006]QPN67078.1 ribonuclease HII [Synechococcus sp. CBW1006]